VLWGDSLRTVCERMECSACRGVPLGTLPWSGCLLLLDGLHDAVSDFIDRAEAVNLGQDAALGVLGHNGLGLLVVQVQAVADDRHGVVAASGLLGTGQEPADQFLVVGSELEDCVELLVAVGQDLVEIVNLSVVRG
jgi:hypothetical protein